MISLIEISKYIFSGIQVRGMKCDLRALSWIIKNTLLLKLEILKYLVKTVCYT